MQTSRLKSCQNKSCQNCKREFSVFIRPYSCELCNENKLCSNCARKFVLSYDPKPSYLRLCDKCCDKVSRGNQLNNSSAKLSKRKPKNSSMWSSLFGRSASRQKAVPPPPNVEHPQSNINFCVPSNPSNLNLSPPTMSCSYCCSSKTQNKLMPHKFAVNNNALKDQAPLFPENHHLSTPKRREKQNVIFQHDQNQHRDLSPLAMAHPVAFDDEEEDSYYLTMHPLNNVKFRAPQSILLAQPNQMALNISINRGETRHYISNLDTTSLCDCFSYSLKRARHIESVENKASAVTETSSQSAHHVTEPALAVDDKDAEDMEMDSEIDAELGQVYDQNTNTFCHCVTVPIQHRTFKLFRIDLLFDPREYAQIVKIANPSSSSPTHGVSEKLVAINVLLHDHESRIWSGVQTATIQQKNGFLLIPQLSLQCNQTLINKSVNIVGSMAWRISDEATDHEADQLPKWYPYRQYTISQMISVLTQQRFDIVDSYDAVIQQRKDSKDLKDDHRDDVEIKRNCNALNQVVPKRSKIAKAMKGSKESESQIAASPESLDPDHIFSDKEQREQRPLTEPEKEEILDPEVMSPVRRPQRLYPVQSDGGSNIPTKRDEKEVILPPQGQQQQLQGDRMEQRGQKENALLTTASSSKHPGILVEEMEKHMLNEEVARIESMIIGLETAMAAIEENDNALLDRHAFDELTESVCSSMMFSTKELNRARSKITDHLSREHGDNEVLSLIPQKVERERNEVKDTPVLNIRRTTLRTVPVCLSCQRCSRTIMLCQRDQ